MSPTTFDDGHLNDTAEEVIGRAVGSCDIVPARLKPQRTGLLFQVRELTTRHFITIDLGSAGLSVAVRRQHIEPALPKKLMRRRASGSRPLSRSDRRSASTIDPRVGCEVLPLMASTAASTASTPAFAAARIVADAIPICRACAEGSAGRSTPSVR